MNEFTEKRVCQRCKYEAPIICGYFNSDYFCKAKTVNHSEDGIYFESEFPLRPGARIYIRTETDCCDANHYGACLFGYGSTVALAEVKWCKELTWSSDYY